MLLNEFISKFDIPNSIILLEGKRNVPAQEQPLLIKLGETLCKKTRYSKFRSGNADGADYLFCKGVSSVDSDRLELILPYSSHRKNFLLTDNLHSLDDIDLMNEGDAVYQTKSNSKNKKLIDLYINGDRGKIGIKGSYLLRDTIKVTGTNNGIPQAVFGVFYDDLENPKSGGTGHTMKMCELNNVPYLDQRIWMNWL